MGSHGGKNTNIREVTPPLPSTLSPYVPYPQPPHTRTYTHTFKSRVMTRLDEAVKNFDRHTHTHTQIHSVKL